MAKSNYTNKREVRIVYGQTLTIDAEGRVVDENAVRAFTNGQCHAFALAVHELTEWEMCGLHWPHNSGSPNHCVAITPEGKLLDIHGLEAEANAEEIGWTGRTPLTKEQIVEGLEYYIKPDVEAALPFARTILAREGYLAKPKRKRVSKKQQEASL